MLVAMIIQGVGMGFTFAVTGDTLLASVPKERAGAASAISETAHEMGGALGIAVLGTVLTSAYRNGLALPPGLPGGPAAEARDTLAGALKVAAMLPGDAAGAVARAARQAFVEGIHVTVLTGAAILLVLAVAVPFALRGVPKVIPETEDEETGGQPAEGAVTAH